MAVAALALGGTAFAQSASPAQAVYGNSEVLGTVNGGGPADVVPGPGTSGGGTVPATKKIPSVRRETGAGTPTPPVSGTGSLPFTGFEAGLVAAAGLALLGTGLAMRRVARRSES